MNITEFQARPLIYLASPIAHKDPEMVNQRRNQAANLAIKLIARGYHVFCPAAYSMALIENGHDTRTLAHEDWIGLDLQILYRCTHFLVYQLDGWKESKGVAIETQFVIDLYMSVVYYSDSDSMETLEQRLEADGASRPIQK